MVFFFQDRLPRRMHGKEVMGVVFHNLYLSSRNMPTVIIMDNETDREQRQRGSDAPSKLY